MRRALLIIIILAATAAATTPIVKHPGGVVTIDTSTLKASEGCFGPTPLLIHLDSLECISKIEPLPNAETPAYWQLVLDKLSTAWNGIPADKVKELKVDAVSGATYSSEGFISNVQTGIAYYLESK